MNSMQYRSPDPTLESCCQTVSTVPPRWSLRICHDDIFSTRNHTSFKYYYTHNRLGPIYSFPFHSKRSRSVVAQIPTTWRKFNTQHISIMYEKIKRYCSLLFVEGGSVGVPLPFTKSSTLTANIVSDL